MRLWIPSHRLGIEPPFPESLATQGIVDEKLNIPDHGILATNCGNKGNRWLDTLRAREK
jgi:hypothetical protein